MIDTLQQVREIFAEEIVPHLSPLIAVSVLGDFIARLAPLLLDAETKRDAERWRRIEKCVYEKYKWKERDKNGKVVKHKMWSFILDGNTFAEAVDAVIAEENEEWDL